MEPQPNRFPNSLFYIVAIFLFVFTVGGCFKKPSGRDGAPDYQVDVSQIHNAVPHYLPKSRYGNRDYHVKGRWYHVLSSARNYDKRGIASWYGTKFEGRLTSTREPYRLLGMTAASPELPIPCYVRVTNLQNGAQVIVKVNDRGPFAANRILDLSYAAAKKLGYAGRGTSLVEVTSIDMPNPINKTRADFAHHQPQMYLQVGAFIKFSNAEHLQEKLKHVTFRNVRIQHEEQGNRLYRVQIGPLQSVEETDNLQARIARVGLGHAITVIG